MGIYACVNLSRLAHQKRVPLVPNSYDYDEFRVVVLDPCVGEMKELLSTCDWDDARSYFLDYLGVIDPEYDEMPRLEGRVFC